MSSIFGRKLKISIFGQSHAEAIGVVIDGFPAGFAVDRAALRAFMARRAPGQHAFATSRKEADEVEFISGLLDDVTCGAPICAVIRNTNTRSEDYRELFDQPRPSHADYPADVRYGGAQDVRGGGHFSGRLTAALCVAGGLCLQYLAQKGIAIGAHIAAIGGVKDTPFDTVKVTAADFLGGTFPVLNEAAGDAMRAVIEAARADGDSVGGIIECAAVGLPAGIGDPMFDGLENRLSAAVFGIPAVRGVEFGNGFEAATLRGSENNDCYYEKDGVIRTCTNNHGGVLGGISTGMPLVFRAAIKPTPSIAKEQQTLNRRTGQVEPLVIRGRHDPCIVPRAVPCVEAACAVVLCDYLI
ncbi:MAG: chorismate synthase [Clostridia bacterium]|nr:chorismate synthase [Clostridia bacterium]